ncbi:MAG: ribosomal RNA small subunit methyltransferase A [Candidatus Omnitrophica bacterium]|nr:ribosomal RNA small subunit methyltransferase A [Candidatus Omnitrophota bacterium]
MFKRSNKGCPGLGFIPKKRLGQNFLRDQRVLRRIIEACELKNDETVLEIGPGQGALTRSIAPYVKDIIAVEADPQLADQLRKDFDPAKLTVHDSDILKFDFSKIQGPIKVVGNLPYYISTPIIELVITNRKLFTSLFMTVQLEFGERLVAAPGSKEYGSFSCFVQFYTKPRILFKIPPSAFHPVPKVTSCFMRLDLRLEPPEEVKDETFFLKVIRQAFLQRRKSLVNSLGALASKDKLFLALSAAGVDPKARAEELGLAQFARIADALFVKG